MKLLSKKGKYAWLAMAVTASLLSGYSAAATEHSQAIIESDVYGNAQRTYWENKGISDGKGLDENTYTFTEDTVLKPKASEATNNTASSSTYNFRGIFKTGDADSTVNMNGHRLDVDMDYDNPGGTRPGNLNLFGIGVTSGNMTIKNVGGMTIKANGSWMTNTSKMTGIYVAGTNNPGEGKAYLAIENKEGWDNAIKFHTADSGNAQISNGINVLKGTGTARLDITGLVDIDMGDRTDGCALNVKSEYSGYQGSTETVVTIGGGRFKSLGTAINGKGGSIHINSTLGTDGIIENLNKQDVKVDGDVIINDTVSKYSPTDNGIFTLALNTQNSYLNGLISTKSYDYFTQKDASGDAYVALKNSATWTNEAKGSNHGSALRQLAGGDGSTVTGYIFQKDSGGIFVDNYSGFTTIYYEHANEGTEAADYTAGDVTISAAKAGSHISLVTDATNIDVDNNDTVGKVLNALAGKLYYTDAKKGETSLEGTVKIAAGLTASDQVLKFADIYFDEETGQGTTKEKGKQSIKDFTTKLTGDSSQDTAYVEGNVVEDDGTYHFDKTTTIITSGNAIDVAKDLTIDADKTLTVTATGKGTNAINIENSSVSKVDITVGKLVISSSASETGVNTGINAGKYNNPQVAVTVNGDLDITATNIEGSNNYVYGIKAGNADITVNGKYTAKIDGGKVGGTNYGSVAGINSTGGNNRGTRVKSNVTVNGDVDIAGNGTGLYANGYGSTITVNGGGKINIDEQTTTKRGYSAIRAEGGIVNMNVAMQNGKATGGLGHDVVLNGNVATTGGNNTAGVVTTINLALDTEKSSVDGVIYNQFGMDGLNSWGTVYQGEINLWLQNGATWTNEIHGYTSPQGPYDTSEEFTGSLVNNFVGGDSEAKAGHIFQKDSETLTIGNYSGYTNIYYAHTGNGEDAADYAAGDTIIKSAAEGSSVSLITDNDGISMNNRDSVSNVLNALAGKLTYEGIKNNENHLTGYVKISSGLTASSKALKTGDITFDENGKGTYVKPKIDTTNFVVPITGNADTDDIYVDAYILQNDGYHFTQDTYFDTSANQNESRIINATKDINILAEGQTLTLEGNTNAKNYLIVNNDKNLTVTAKKLALQAGSDTATAAIGITATGKTGGDLAKVTIHGDVDVKANSNDSQESNECGSFGIYAKDNAAVTIKGTFIAKSDNGWAIDSHNRGSFFYHSAGLYATSSYGEGQHGASIQVDKVDMKLNGNGALANIDGATIDIGGGTIEVNKANTKGYASLMATCGTINMNVTKDEEGQVTGAGKQDVTLKGNVDVNTGAINDNDIETKTTINLGLSTEKSSLQGVIRNGFSADGNTNYDYAGKKLFYGFTNLWLQNGAQWTNELYGKLGENYYVVGGHENQDVFEGSHLTNLYGGTSENQAGHIFQNDIATHFNGQYDEEDNPLQSANTLTIDHYSGYTNIYYAHEGNGEDTANYKAGDTIIKSAAKDASVSLITDNKGITMDSISSVTKVLNALAGKLLYSGYANGEKNLTGYVKIADDLTSSSAALKIGDITFAADGRGTYVKPAHDTQTTTDFTTTLTGNTDKDGEYEEGGVIDNDGSYWFTQNSTITTSGNAIDAAKDLTIKADKTLTVTANGGIAMNVLSVKNANITAGKLVLKTTSSNGALNAGTSTNKATISINGNVDINAKNSNEVFGINATNADVKVNGNFSANIDSDKGGYSYTGVSAIFAKGQAKNKWNEGFASSVTVNGNVDITANGNALHANGNGATITVNGGGSINITDKTRGHSALRADNGTINMNVSIADGKATGGLGKDVTLKGNLAATNGAGDSAASIINVALDKAKSSLEGVAYTAGNNSAINLWLQNGASWTNKVHGATEKDWQGNDVFKGSSIANFVGGTSEANAGSIFQKDSNALTIDNYSGYTNIYYVHTGNGEDTANYTAGDTIIKKVAAGSSISLITDNDGITMTDKYSVAKVLNALAGKLTYGAYANGERNLSGFVKIADGLTASNVIKKTGDITFDENGKGTYVKPVETEFTTPITTDTGDNDYDKEGIRNAEKTKYTFTKDTTVTVSGLNAIDAQGDSWDPAKLVVNAADKDLTLKTNQRGMYFRFGDASITANDLYVTADDGNGRDSALVYNDRSTAIINGNINGTVNGSNIGSKNISVGLYATGGNEGGSATTTIHGDVTSKKDNGYGITGKKGSSTFGIKAENRGTITVDGDVDMTVNGTGINAANKGAVNVNGLKMEVADGFNSLLSDNGTINVNMNADQSAAGDKAVVLKGNVSASNGGVINLGMNKGSSKLTGTISGNTNLWLVNGATWDNNGTSTVAKLVGGSDASTAGHIWANGGMTIDNYSGYTNIYYAHEGNGESAENYKAGDTTIKSAAKGSVITLVTDVTSTDNIKVDMTNHYSVANVLDALAGKLIYSNFATNDEKNLTGYVKIAEGLTASSVTNSVTKHTGMIAFDSKTGKGSLKDGEFTPDVTYPGHQIEANYSQAITGVEKDDYIYKQKGVLKDAKYTFTTNPTNVKVDTGAAVDAKADITIKSTEAKLVLEGKEAGIRTNGNTISVEGTTDIKGETGIRAVGGKVTLKGTTTVTANGGVAISATNGGEVSIAPKDSAVTITGNMVADGSGSKITIDPGKTTGTIKGNVEATDNGSITINLEENHSTLTGSFFVKNASLTMNIKNGATWKLTDGSTDTAVQAAKVIATMSLFAAPQAAASPTGLTVNGGSSKDSAGILDMTDRTQDVTIDHYTGWETVIMNRDANGYTSGNVKIQQAGEGSGIALFTNNDGIKMTDKDAVTTALEALAKKVTYADGQDATNGKNLTGFAAIGSGLTASDVKTGKMDFANLEGQLLKDTIQWEPTIEVGDYETFIMKGVRSAATTSFHAWRDNMQDTYTGADLADEDGIFAKAYGGKTSSDVKGVKDSNSYWGAQVGYDKALNNGWHTGVAFDYRDGDSNYLLGGKGDNKLYSFGVYGVKKMADQSYFRIAAKAGRVENEYDVYNELRSNKLHGDFKSSAYGLTAEYGKTFGDETNTYLTPKVQLTWTRVGSKDYTATASNGAKMSVFQDSYDSLVGRLGFEAGMKKAKGSYHAGLYIAHEFNGDINTSYSAKDGGDKSTSFDGEDTWAELVLGGDYSVGKNTQLYADFTRDFSGDFQKKWKLNAGIRLRF